MRSTVRRLLAHPVVRTLLLERLLITGSAVLAFAAVAMGRVRPAEIPGLLDMRLLTLFVVLIVAVELGKQSDLFDALVVRAIRRVRTSRALAGTLLAVTAVLAALLTNDVALLLVVPFTMRFRSVTDMELAPVVVLEVAAANLVGCVSPIGTPQNFFLYARGGFTLGGFLAAQALWVGAAAFFLFAAVPMLVPQRALQAPRNPDFDVAPALAAGFLVLLALEVASILNALPHWMPLVAAVPAALLLGRRIREADFSLVFVFAFLLVGITGLERGALYEALNPERLLGHRAQGLVLSGALLSQFVSNVPAAMLLAPTASSFQGFRALLYGVNAGGCGTPISSLANLIGAQVFVREGGSRMSYWRFFAATSSILLVLMVLVSLALIRV
jgi:Na+/H+ antiporter NhaD/arsenite permease-like protein